MAMGVFAQQTATATQPPKPAAATAQAPAPTAAKSAPATTAPAQAKPAAAPAKVAPKADSTKTDSAKVAPTKTYTVYVYKDTTKVKPRGKKFFKDHQDSVMAEKAERDSLTTHHGVSIMGGRNHDHRYGYISEDNNWGFGAGLYYFYRHYFGSHFALEGRFGGIYRYARWTEDFDFPQYYNVAKIGNGKYDLNHHFDLYYDNYAVDVPLSAKVGGHVGATEFLYAGVSLGLTKSFYEKVTSRNELTLKNVPEDLAKDLEILDKEGKNPFPMVEDHYTSDWVQMCDWETNAWVNVGLDSKFVSLEAQVLIISAASTDHSHRFEYLGHDLRPTWRLFMDFSIR